MSVVAALEQATLPHHARRGDTAAALAEILDPAITMAIWRRSPPFAVNDLDGFGNVRLTTHRDEAAGALATALSTWPSFPWTP